MRKINGKLLFGLLVATAMLAGGVAVAHHFQYQRIGRALLFQAQRAGEQGEAGKQARFLQRYLEFNPRDHGEKANLARIWATDPAASPRRKAEAVRLLDEVLTYEDGPELRRLLVRTAVELGDYKRAREHVGVLLRWQDLEGWVVEDSRSRETGKPLPDFMAREDKDRGELELFWGQVLEQENKSAEALGCYRLASRHAPQQPEAYLRLAYLLRRGADGPAQRAKVGAEADRAIDQMVERNVERHDSYLARWRYRREFDLLATRETAGAGQVSLEVAAEDVAAALKRKPDAIDALLAAADLERLRGRAAAGDVQRPPAQRLADLKAHRAKASEFLKKGLDLVARAPGAAGGPAEFQLLWHKGNLLLDDLDMDRADQGATATPGAKAQVAEVIERVRKSRMPAAADYMQGRLLVNDQKWAEAASLLEKARALLAAQPDLSCQADLYLGQCYERLEEHTQMYNAYKRVADHDPNSVAAQLGMAAARWAQGKLDGAYEQFEAALRQQRVPPRAWIDMARLELQRQAVSSKPDWAAVERWLAGAERHDRERGPDIALLRAEALHRQGKGDEARAVLEKARDAAPQQVEVWSALVDLALRGKQIDRARKVVEEAKARLGDAAGARLIEARYLAAKGGAKAKAEIAALARDRAKLKEAEQARLLSALADTLYRLGGTAEARALWQDVVKLPGHRSDLRLQMLLFDLAVSASDEAGMMSVLADIRAIEQSSGTYHRYGQALLHIWRAKQAAPGDARAAALRQARQELDVVLTQRPSWGPVFLARAEIADLNGNTEQAIRDLDEAIKNGEASPSVIRRQVTLLTQKGRDNEAQQLLARVPPAALAGSDLARVLVGIQVRNGNVNDAVKQMRQMIREENQGPQELVWQARVLAAAGEVREAEQKLDQAIRMAGDDPTPWLGKVQFLVEQKRKEEAVKLVEQLQKKLPPAKADLALARGHDFVGNYPAALTHYRRALKAAPNDPVTVKAVASAHLLANRGREAEPLLDRIVRGQVVGMSPADVAWARRGLAVALASGTDYQRFKRALDLVGLKLDENGKLLKDDTRDEDTEQQRARARVLASQNQKQFRQRAIELFKDLGRRNALTPDDEFVLAILHDQEGETRESQEKLKRLSDRPQYRTPQYLAQYAMSLIVHQRLPEHLKEAETVIGWVEQLERDRELPPNTFATVELRARLLEARGKGDEAVALLNRHTSRAGAAAEEALLVIASYGRQKRFADALGLCEKLWKSGQCLPEAVGSVSVALLGVMGPTDSQVASIEKHLKDALARKPTNTLRLHLADLYDKRGRYDEAADLYREVLKTEKNNVVALNNLAWLLTLRAGDARQALGYIDDAIRGIGRRADLLDTRGLVLLALKDPSQALADLKDATGEAPTATRLLHLARAHHEGRDRVKAREALRQAKEKGLQVSSLHSLEQEGARKLLDEYGLRGLTTLT